MIWGSTLGIEVVESSYLSLYCNAPKKEIFCHPELEREKSK